MVFAFEEFELDPARRELRVHGRVRSLQRQVFDLLAYLVANHERVVPKHELLETLWPDAVVTESSVQRAVSLARSALGERGPALIQTFPRQGYRFVGKVAAPRTVSREGTLRPTYARSGDVHIAYATFGSGDIDLVLVNGWIMPMRGMFRHPEVSGLMDALSRKGRVIMFDKRGTGLSDRVKDIPSHEQRMDDLRAVLDACGSEQAVLIGVSEGGALAMIYAATYPERVRGLVLCGAFVRMAKAPGFPYGYGTEAMVKLRDYIRGGWGKGASLRAVSPSQTSDPAFLEWVAFAEQEGASPGGALDLLEMNLRLDLRALVPSIRVPTVVLQALDDRMIDPGNGAYLAEHIPKARYIAAPGDDHTFYFGGKSRLLEAVDWVRSQEQETAEEDRFLSTVLVIRPAEGANRDPWHHLVRQFRGHVVPGRMHAYFDGPARALRCGAAVAAQLPASGGVHAGEVVRRSTTVEGAAFSVAEGIAQSAGVGEVRASQVVVDLVPGSDLSFLATGGSFLAKGRDIAVFSLALHS